LVAEVVLVTERERDFGPWSKWRSRELTTRYDDLL